MQSAQNISLSNVPLYTIDATFNAKGAISISGVSFGTMDFNQNQSISATADTGDITLTSSSATYATNTNLRASAGNLTLTDSEIGAKFASITSLTTADSTTFLSAYAAKQLLVQSVTNTHAGIWADDVQLTSSGDLTVQGGATVGLEIGPTDSNKGVFNALSKTGGVTLANTLIYHYTVNITAGGDVVRPEATSAARDGTSLTAAQLKNIIDLNNVGFSNADRVALDATTVVLKDVSFKDGSKVFLNSYFGKVAAYPGMGAESVKPDGYAARVPGYVNFVSNVRYGEVLIKLPNASQAMNDAAFHAAAAAQSGVGPLNNIKIGYQTGNAATVK
jgi:hypothetical protein